ncbi:MAG: DUF6325 family protein [Ilumatobacteraceae bacterium]
MANEQGTDPADELGPIDYIVVEFPGTTFDGTIAPAIDDLVDRGLVRVLDLLILVKDDAGSVEVLEVSDLADDSLSGLQRYESELAMLLSESDVENIAQAIEPGATAAVLVWENLWAAPFGAAVRHNGGQLVASGRIPIQAMLAVLEEDDAAENGK